MRQLGLRVAVERSYCFLFKGTIIAHKAGVVTSGQHNFVDLFCNKSVYDIKNHKARDAGLPIASDKRKVWEICPFLDC